MYDDAFESSRLAQEERLALIAQSERQTNPSPFIVLTDCFRISLGWIVVRGRAIDSIQLAGPNGLPSRVKPCAGIEKGLEGECRIVVPLLFFDFHSVKLCNNDHKRSAI